MISELVKAARLSPGVFTISRVFTLIISLLLISAVSIAQEYPSLSVNKSYKLDSKLSEISGITFSNGKIYAINDSGNKNEVYILDQNTFDIVSSQEIYGTKNIDWEEISSYNNTLYIGDFGNNAGNRKDLKIYKILPDSIYFKKSKPEIIEFKYELQESFNLREYRKHSWDCEAMVINRQGIWLFSKDWRDRTCRLYKLENQPRSKVSLRAIDSLNLKYLVTGAFNDDVAGKTYLCGYEGGNTYLTVLSTGEYIDFSGEYTTYIIPELKYTQVESIFVKENLVYLASERTISAQTVYKIILPGKK